MDNRLFSIYGRRPARIRAEDLPEVADALLEALNGRAAIFGTYVSGIDVVVIRGAQANFVILKDDWALIEPLIQNGTLKGTSVLNNNVLSQLQLLFTEHWPTSNI